MGLQKSLYIINQESVVLFLNKTFWGVTIVLTKVEKRGCIKWTNFQDYNNNKIIKTNAPYQVNQLWSL